MVLSVKKGFKNQSHPVKTDLYLRLGAISKMNGMLEIKDNQFIEIPIEKNSVLNKVELKNVKEIGKGDKIFLRILKYSSLIGASLIIYSLVSL